MKITRNIKVPTGNILIGDGAHGPLEFLSIGDYGKDVNLKCDAMGLTRKPGRVEHTDMLPLSDKWVITISTQYGCSMKCTFCDVPKVGPGRNATLWDLLSQVYEAKKLHPEVTEGKRLNIHFARMGEPTFNMNVIEAAKILAEIDGFPVHSVVSTMMPKNNRKLDKFLRQWMRFKNCTMEGEAGLQLSINSTNETERSEMFGGSAMRLQDIHGCMRSYSVYGRKITLNFAVAGYEIDPKVLLKYFDPLDYIVKLTPMHKTKACENANINTPGNYTEYHPYESYERDLIAAGYDVLVFIASEYEDLGRITCGNAILSGTKPLCPYDEME
jgi:23S rRNA (adenine2503-C2)-methyltransferase